MMYKEIILKSLLVVACLYLAGLNLWLLFKDWLSENYEKKGGSKKKTERVSRVGISKTVPPIPDFVGKSKFNLQEERNRRQADKDQLKKIDENQLLLSIPLENFSPPLVDDQPLSSEEEIILEIEHDKTDAELAGSQSFTMDEFEMMAKSLSCKAVTKEEGLQAAEIIPRIKGTNVYQQFIGQVKGAENRAMEILRMSENDESDNQSDMGSLSKFIRT